METIYDTPSWLTAEPHTKIYNLVSLFRVCGGSEAFTRFLANMCTADWFGISERNAMLILATQSTSLSFDFQLRFGNLTFHWRRLATSSRAAATLRASWRHLRRGALPFMPSQRKPWSAAQRRNEGGVPKSGGHILVARTIPGQNGEGTPAGRANME